MLGRTISRKGAKAQRKSTLVCLVFLCAFAPLREVRAALDPELKTPYQVHVVLSVAEHRFFTPLFQDELRRDVGNRLQLAFGGLAQVEVTKSHPFLGEVQAKGLEAVDAIESLSDRRTCFVLVDYVDGRYEARTRFHDGKSGLVSPRVRRASTYARNQVAATIARLLHQDFVPTGAVTTIGKEIQVAFQGSGLGKDVDKFLQPGEVLAISRLVQEGGKTRAERIDWALLEALETPRGDVVKCRYWHRYQEDELKEKPDVLGYRCLKLPTGPGKLRVQLVDDKTQQPLANWQVHVTQGANGKKLEQATKSDGLAVFAEPLQHFALVKVLSGKTVRAQFPVPLMDDRPIVCRLRGDAAADAQASLEIRRDQWLRRLYDNLALAAERSGELQRLLIKSFETALSHARAGLTNLQGELEHLTGERTELDRLTDARKIPRFDLADGDQRLEELATHEKTLTAFIGRLEKIVKESGSAEELGLKKLLERAGLAEAETDFEQAIALYAKALQVSPDSKDIKARVEALRSGWKVKNDKHAQAREYIYQSWPRLETAELKSNLPKAQQALAVCKETGDKLSPRKLLLANATHAANLKKRLEDLRRRDSQDNRAQAKVIAETAEGLRQLHAEAAAWVKKKE